MKNIISILLLFTMLLQAIPVLHFFAAQPEVFYTILDEEKPAEENKKGEEKKLDEKALLGESIPSLPEIKASFVFGKHTAPFILLPHLDLISPPPDFC